MKRKRTFFMLFIIFFLLLSCSSKSPIICTQTSDMPGGNPLNQVCEGMIYSQVIEILGDPDDWNKYQTGKAFIPFYFGKDTERLEARYAGMGTVVYSCGGFGGDPVVIEVIYNEK